jgi:hypothetical protein
MQKLQGSDDLTLVRFLMSCSSNGEIVEYITAYLGKSTEVSLFTSEFIRRKFAEASGKKVRHLHVALLELPCFSCGAGSYLFLRTKQRACVCAL